MTTINPSKPATFARRVESARQAARLVLDCAYDCRRYLRLSATTKPYADKRRHQARLTMSYHKIEKALSLKSPRVGFGRPVVRTLVTELGDYVARYGSDELARVALDVLEAYDAFHDAAGQTDLRLRADLLRLRPLVPGDRVERGGVESVEKRHALDDAAAVDFGRFAASRHSVRHFADDPVDGGSIERAVTMALRTPSVCNRQAWKVHSFREPDQKARILPLQNGNGGFGADASHLLLVTCDLSAFAGPGERHQGFIDGGMFAMSLVYALHSLGLGTCCLNLSVGRTADRRIRREAGISDAESLVMLIAVGHLPDQFRVARSWRKPLSDVLVDHSLEPRAAGRAHDQVRERAA